MNHFQTSDFGLAITLVSLGFKIDHLDQSNTHRIQFCFERSNRLDETIQAFWRDEIRIEPKVFLLNHKLLKARIHNAL